jgi:four helix bundle protein
MHRYKELKIWKKAVELSTGTYALTERFPKSEAFGLTSQIRRSSVSVASNIAEGAGRGSDKVFNNFLSIAVGSLFELETQLIISNEVGFLQEDDLEGAKVQIEHLANMIFKFKTTLKAGNA